MSSTKEVITNHNQFFVEFPTFEREVSTDENGGTKIVKLFAMSFIGEGYVDNFICEESIKEELVLKLVNGMTAARKKKLAAQLTTTKRK